VAGRPKTPPAMQNASQKSWGGGGGKNKEVRGTKFKIVANRCHLLRLKCTKFDFGWGSSPDPLTEFAGVLLLREGKGMGGNDGREGEGEEKKERGKEGKGEGEGGEGKEGGRLRHGFWGDGRP